MTALRAALARATERLTVAGVPSPRVDAEELAAHSLGVSRRDLWGHDDPGDEFDSYVGRRAAREPLQHITGQAHFRHLTLAVGPGVFVPRPETEVVVEAALVAARSAPSPRVVDLGTGSGAIALAVATELPRATVHAVEADPAAHAWAVRNCAGSSVDLRLGDMAAAFDDLDGTVDVVVSNPPYIPVGASVRDPEVAQFDPSMALWSGSDGLDAVRTVEQVAARLLRPGGTVVVEHADLQGVSAPAVFLSSGRWIDVVDHRDLAGRDRYLTATRTPSSAQ
ncbi:MAG: peptide chain release factor N(5)-glutamine methyltransferase [Spirochaetaceae bacterium]|nr:peptide chain release factor N(5)-glutamine methyltransferase [Spirochaetaceae bacterium]